MLQINTHQYQVVNDASETQGIAEKLHNVHNQLYRQLRSYGINLHPNFTQAISFQSISDPFAQDVVALRYFRGSGEAQAVERMMADGHEYEPTHDCHPAIEIRVTPTHFAIELIIAPSAWWDQQNLVGKLTVERQRSDFYRLLRQMSCEVQLGFWQGTELSDMHLSTCDIYNPRILGEWMNTFAEGQDWVRAGVWYDLNDPALSDENLASEVFQRICELYKLYNFIVWTSDNDFRSVYRKLLARTA
ncbi:MAG: hypothetical protein U0694_09140 [Anaerolineae bacterium]